MTEDEIGFDGGINFFAYNVSNPINYIDPFGLCQVDVRFKKIGPKWYHAYIVTTDINGIKYYYRGGPSGEGPSSGVSGGLGSASSGSSSGKMGSHSSKTNNSGNSSSPGSGPGGNPQKSGPWGPIITDSGPYVKGTIDWDSGSPVSMNISKDNNPCKCINDKLAKAVKDIQNKNVPYNPFSSNSNATVRQALEQAGLKAGVPPVWVPGWDTHL